MIASARSRSISRQMQSNEKPHPKISVFEPLEYSHFSSEKKTAPNVIRGPNAFGVNAKCSK